jgi:hypothetical protein
VCGCFRGNIEEFECAVKENHGDNDHAKKYERFICFVREVFKKIGVCRVTIIA